MGFQYSSIGVSPSDERIQAFANLSELNSAKKLWSFLGLTNFYWWFVYNFVEITTALTELTSSKQPFKFHHFFLGAPFLLETDHKLLMWLESAKPSHARSQRSERWSLNLWTFEFQGVHCLGIHNVHADTLSRFPLSLVVVEVPLFTSQISQAQCEDPILSTVIQRLGTSNDKSTPSDKWNKFFLHCYKQIWA